MIRSACVALSVMIFCAASAVAQVSLPCGPSEPCELETGSYHLMAPETWDGETPLPLLVYFHGHRSSGATIFRSGGLKQIMNAGFLIVAPNGAMRPDSEVRAWPARPTGQDVRDDVAFTLAVLDDVAERFPIDITRVFAAGFSAGGSMAWMIACYAPERFSGFASIAGALRRPVPAGTCPGGPMNFLHIHGFADKQVPLEGRGIRDWHQGDVFASLGLARDTNQCRSQPDEIEIGDKFRCRIWNSCTHGALKMCLHDGGHGIPRGWVDLALPWMQALPPRASDRTETVDQ